MTRLAALLVFALALAGCEMADSSGGFTLSWTLPTQNTDGSSLDDLAGIRVYEVSCPGDLDRGPLGASSIDGAQTTGDATCSEPWSLTVEADLGPDVTTYSGVTSPGWHYWGLTSFDAAGNESALSNVGGKNILDQLFPQAPTDLRVE